MSKYAGMFGDTAQPAVRKVNLLNIFGEAKSQDTQIRDIETWMLKTTGPVNTTANRIKYILNGFPMEDLRSIHIHSVGEYQVAEATEANKCTDEVVNMFAAMKTELERPKSLILAAIDRIAEATTPKGFLSRIRSSKPDWNQLRASVSGDIREATDKMENVLKYHLEPFIDGLLDAVYTLESVAKNLQETIDTLNYVIESTKDADLQDLARRRKEMFTKSHALMTMNLGQVHTMQRVCEQNKHFAEELNMTIKPVIENVMRSAIIDGTDDETSMRNLQTKLKAIL